MLKNLINEVLLSEGMSINQLSQKLGLTYANTHSLVNREDLTDTKLGTLVDVARILRVGVNDLFKNEVAELDSHFNKDEIIILVRENGGDTEYKYEFFKEDFEEWARDLEVTLASTEDLKEYLVECGYKVLDIKEV